MVDIPLEEVAVGDLLVVFPHETCPVDAVVVEGRSTMDESYLTGEPYVLSKVAGSAVLSGAINGDGALTIRAETSAVDSRYAKIMQVMRESEQRRPATAATRRPDRRVLHAAGGGHRARRLGRQRRSLAISGRAGGRHAVSAADRDSGRDHRFRLAGGPARDHHQGSRRAGKDRHVPDGDLRQDRHAHLRTAEADGGIPADGFTSDEVLAAVASLERYSRHPLAAATIDAARQAGLALADATEVSERPGEGLRGIIGGRAVQVTSRKKLLAQLPDSDSPAAAAGRRAGVRGADRRSVRGHVPVPRRTAGGRQGVHPPPEAAPRVRARPARLRRPGIGSTLSGREGRHHGGVRRARAPSRSWRSCARRRPRRRPCSWATGSTTPRP